MISESTPNNSRCIPYAPATYGPSPVFGGTDTFATLGYGFPGATPTPPTPGLADLIITNIDFQRSSCSDCLKNQITVIIFKLL